MWDRLPPAPVTAGVAFALVLVGISMRYSSFNVLEGGSLETACETKVRLVCFGDTHLRHRRVSVPEGDILVYTGDITDPHSDKPNEVQLKDFDEWLGSFPHRHKIVVAGNHDAEKDVTLKDLQRLLSSARYVQDELVEFPVGRCGKKVTLYGSPWQHQWPGDPQSETYLPEGPLMEAKWKAIPAGVDILATHSPPFKRFDKFVDGKHIGSVSLLKEVVERVKPKLHCFGHVHAGRTSDMMSSQGSVARAGSTIFVNGAICNDDLEPIWDPVVVDLLL